MKIKSLTLIFFLTISSFNLFGQSNCDPPVSQIDLSNNNIRARLLTGGDFWWDGSDGRYIAPKVPPGQPEVSALFAGSLWMTGIDAEGNLRLAAQTYGRISGNFDYYPGPILAGPNPNNSETCNYWDKFFTVTAEDIAAHKADLADNGIIDGPIPVAILGWPANDNQFFYDVHHFELPDENIDLAPFFDHNENGWYEPDLGDYPLVKGDESIWWVYNDVGNLHNDSEAGIAVLGMEIQANAFAYASDTAYIDNTTFYEFKLTLKKDQPLNNVYIGLWVDPDLGCHTDDYIGCNPAGKTAFIYNGDNFDDAPCQGNVYSYEDTIPVVAIKILKALENPDGEGAPFAYFTYYLNNSFSNAPPGTSDPQNPIEYFNYLTGRWRDGTPFSQGGIAYNPGADPYPYAFDGSEVEGLPWTECNANTIPSDRRFLMSFGPINMSFGDTREFAFAVIWKGNQEYPCPDLSIIDAEADLVEEFYIRKTEELLVASKEAIIPTPNIQVIPNPMQESVLFLMEDKQSLIQEISLYSATGQLVKSQQGIDAFSAQIHRNGLPGGIYVYQLILQDGRMHKGKLVIE